MQGADYFPSKVWPLHLQRMRQFLDQHDQLLLVLGDSGTGKSSLLKHLYDLGNLPGNCLDLKGKSALQPQKLTKLIAKKWHLDMKLDQTFRQHQLDDILTAMQKFHQPGLLIIDDAHLLPIATLAALMHMCLSQETDQIVLRILLIGEPSLARTLSNLHHPDIVIPTIQLQPLNREETKLFLEHVLDQIGFGKTRPLKDNQIDELYQQSKGIAAQARTLVVQHMRKHHPHKFDDSKSGAVITSTVNDWLGKHWIKVASLGMLGLAFLGMHQYQLHMNSLNQMVLQQPEQLNEQKHSPLPALAHYTPQITTHKSIAAKTKPAATTNADNPISSPASHTKQLAEANTASNQPKPSTLQTTPDLASTVAAISPQTAQHPSNNLGTPPSKPLRVAASTPTKPAAIPATVATTPVRVETPGIKALAKQPPKRHFVLQVMGDYNQHRVIAMQQKLSDNKTQIHQSQRNNKIWYTLTYGNYSQLHLAKQAMKSLPKAIKALHPWIKPINKSA